MNKILVKILILVVVAALSYSVFWFFKIGQVEKHIKKAFDENSAHMSLGELTVSGFPLSQKITVKDLKFTIPGTMFGNRQVIAKHVEANSGLFSSDFVVTLVEPVQVQDAEGNALDVQFAQAPEISFSIADGRVAKFSYRDLGYKISDSSNNTIYAASASKVSFESLMEGEKITYKIDAGITDIEGFDVLDIYKNSAEKKIIEGLKTGEITVGGGAQAGEVLQSAAPDTSVAQIAGVPTQAAVDATPAPVANSVSPQDPNAPAAQDLSAAVANNNLIKSNFMVTLEYSLTPSEGAAAQAQIPTDPTQIQETPVQYSKKLKVVNFEFSNPLYKLTVSGEVDFLQDDAMPSGSLSVRVEKISDLVNYLSAGFVKIAENAPVTKNSAAPNAAADAAAVPATDASKPADAAASAPVVAPAPAAPLQDSQYQEFLKKFAANLVPVIKELAAKNAVSKDEIAVFDVRREKNLEFLINETSVREILGKF